MITTSYQRFKDDSAASLKLVQQRQQDVLALSGISRAQHLPLSSYEDNRAAVRNMFSANSNDQ